MGWRTRMGLMPAALLLLAGCGDDGTSEARTAELAEIREAGELVVLTRNAPTTYYIDRNGRPAGPEYDLVAAFADHLGVDRSSVSKALSEPSTRRVKLICRVLTLYGVEVDPSPHYPVKRS